MPTDDSVTFTYIIHAFSKSGYRTRHFVPDEARKIQSGQDPLELIHLARAYAAHSRLDQNLAGPRLRLRLLFYGEATGFLKNGCSHDHQGIGPGGAACHRSTLIPTFPLI